MFEVASIAVISKFTMVAIRLQLVVQVSSQPVSMSVVEVKLAQAQFSL